MSPRTNLCLSCTTYYLPPPSLCIAIYQSPSRRGEKVKRHAALVLGNICQTDAHRKRAGKEGAVEGLFALCDANDRMVQANALWALGNLAWDHCNQVDDTTNKYLPDISAVLAHQQETHDLSKALKQ